MAGGGGAEIAEDEVLGHAVVKLSQGVLPVRGKKGSPGSEVYGGGSGRRRRAKTGTKEEGHESFRSCRFGFVQHPRATFFWPGVARLPSIGWSTADAPRRLWAAPPVGKRRRPTSSALSNACDRMNASYRKAVQRRKSSKVSANLRSRGVGAGTRGVQPVSLRSWAPNLSGHHGRPCPCGAARAPSVAGGRPLGYPCNVSEGNSPNSRR
jgi:hypothetical protein